MAVQGPAESAIQQMGNAGKISPKGKLLGFTEVKLFMVKFAGMKPGDGDQLEMVAVFPVETAANVFLFPKGMSEGMRMANDWMRDQVQQLVLGVPAESAPAPEVTGLEHASSSVSLPKVNPMKRRTQS